MLLFPIIVVWLFAHFSAIEMPAMNKHVCSLFWSSGWFGLVSFFNRVALLMEKVTRSLLKRTLLLSSN